MTEKKNKQTKPSNNLHCSSTDSAYPTVMISLGKRFYFPPRHAEGYKGKSSLVEVIFFTGAKVAGAGTAFASLFQCS